MNKFLVWWKDNHPFKSNHLAVRYVWFILVVLLGTITYAIGSFGSSCVHFWEEMKYWFKEVRSVYPKLYKKGK